MTALTWFSRRLTLAGIFFESSMFMAGNVSRDLYRGWRVCCIAVGGLEAKARARVVVLGRKSPSADMLG
jgi:hypothetical protein